MKNNYNYRYNVIEIPKITLHEHLEGTLSPELALQLAKKHQVDLNNLIDKNNCYNYDKTDFNKFLHAYDTIANLVKDPDDYYHATYSFLNECANANGIYAELIISPEHMIGNNYTINNKDFKTKMNAIENAITDAKNNLNISTNLIATGVRNKGVENVNQVANFIKRHPHKHITGFGIAGNELDGSFKQYASGFMNAKKSGLRLSLHAGEIAGPENIWEAIKYGADRIGHGISAIEDKKLLDFLANNKILLEICPTSNIVLVPNLKQNYDIHPLRKLYENGVKVSLNTDDAGLVGASLNGEYQIAKEKFGFNRTELLDITLCGIEAAFTDSKEKKELFSKVYDTVTKDDLQEFKDNAKNSSNKILELRMKNRSLGKYYE